MSSKILIGNGILITRDRENHFYDKGAVCIEGERILEAGDHALLLHKYPDAEYIDAEGMLIMPGYINNHEHIYSEFARGASIPGSAPKNFLEILDGTWWHIDRNLALDETYYSAAACYIECIRNGVTFVSDHHASFGGIRGSLNKIADAAKMLGVRTCLSYEVSDRDGMEKRDDSVNENIEFIDRVHNENSNMLKGLIGLHASFTLSDETLEMCAQKNVHDAGYHVHVAEGLYDEEHSRKTYGKSVVRRFYDMGILKDNSIAVHCNHISEDDMDLIAERKTTVIHNPESNMGNAVGAPDMITMMDKGIRVGLGTDGYTNDMMESLKVANILQKHRRGLPDRGFLEACRMCFDNNTSIASDIIGERYGAIEAGLPADVILVDYHPVTPLTGDNVNGHLMFGVNGAMTDTTIINGKVLMRHRKLVQADEEQILSKSREAAAALWKKL